MRLFDWYTVRKFLLLILILFSTGTGLSRGVHNNDHSHSDHGHPQEESDHPFHTHCCTSCIQCALEEVSHSPIFLREKTHRAPITVAYIGEELNGFPLILIKPPTYT